MSSDKPPRVKIYQGDLGFPVLIDMKKSVVGSTDISIFVRDADGVVTEETSDISIINYNFFKWIVPAGITDLAGTVKLRPHFTLDGWIGSGKVVSFDVESVDDTTPPV